MNSVSLAFGALYGFQHKNKKDFKDIGTFFCCWTPVSIVTNYIQLCGISDRKYITRPLLGSVIGTPPVVAIKLGIGTLIGTMACKAVKGEDA
jgi:hypothetical protein